MHVAATSRRPSRRSTSPPGPSVEELKLLIDVPQAPSVKKGGQKFTPTEWAAYALPQFVEAVATSYYYDLDPLWKFDATVGTVIDAAHVEAIAAEIVAEAATLGSKAYRVTFLMYYLQIAYYHEFYQATVDYSDATNLAVRNALIAVGNSVDFEGDDYFMDWLRGQWAGTVDSTDNAVYVVPEIQSLFERYAANPNLKYSWVERGNTYALLDALRRQIENQAAFGAGSVWYNALSANFVASIYALCDDPAYYSPEEYVVNNAVWLLGQISVLNNATRLLGQQPLTDGYNTFPHDVPPFIWAVQALQQFYGSKLADNSDIDVNAIRSEIISLLFPQTYTFDNGKLTFRTSIGRARVDQMYDALQEVESQFFRLVRNLSPVPGDNNPTLTAWVYGSPYLYHTYQYFLNGTGTNNGGIYIEQTGDFYTFDRLPTQSSLTLEELFRHEYVHYLDGRYQVTGEFGDPGIFDNSRLVWYNEGLAELCAGATQLNGILPRRKYIEAIENDAKPRMTIPEIVGVSYNYGFRFYNYAYYLQKYLEEQQPRFLIQILDAIRANNVAEVDALYAQLENTPSFQSEYTAYLDALIAADHAATRTFKEDVPTARAPKNLPAANQQNLYDAILATGAVVNPSSSIVGNRFIFSATLTRSIGLDATYYTDFVRQSFVNQMDARLNALYDEYPNFRAATAWFGDVQPSGNNATASIFIETPYCPGGCSPTIWYVDKANAANPTQDGTSWATAFSDLQPAIDAAFDAGGDEIWVAVGVYNDYRTNVTQDAGVNNGALVLRHNTKLYGGFLGLANGGLETSRDQRVLWYQQPVIAGDTARDGDRAYHVVQMQDGALLDNFIVEGGEANGVEGSNQTGGGIHLGGVADATIRNCFVSDNKAQYGGAGIYVVQSNLLVENCYINGNSTDAYGGGMYIYACSPTLRNLIVWNNHAGQGSGLLYYAGAGGNVSNVTVYNNTGGASAITNAQTGTPVFTNCIVWNPAIPAEFEHDGISGYDVSYSDVRGGYAGTGNINTDPLLINPNGGDFQLQAASPCRDAGTTLNAPTEDIFGNPRPMNLVYDMGAREYPGSLPEPEGEVPIDDGYLSCDQNKDYKISLGELLRVIQFYNSFGYHCQEGTEDGYAPGLGLDYTCEPYDTDYNLQDWTVSFPELLRTVQIYNTLAYHFCPADGTEDGFCPGP